MKLLKKLQVRLFVKLHKQWLMNSNILLVGVALFLFVSSLQFVLAQDEAQNESNVNGLTRILTTNTVGEQTTIEIKTEFSMTTIDRDSMIDEIKSNFSLTREDAEVILQSQTEKTVLKEKFDVRINSRKCVSQVTTDLVFVLNTSDKEKILDAIVERSQLEEKQINQALEFEIDKIDLNVRVQSGKAQVLVQYCDLKPRFVINSIDEQEIISEIKSKTGLREYKIPLIWNFVTDVQVQEERPLTPEEQREQALKYGEGVFSQAEQQMQKAEQAQQLTAEGGDLPASLTGGGGCLIATATYGTELSPQVQMLREIRDNAVLGTHSGTAFMSAFNLFYYSFSPAIADLERQNPVFKEMVKITITPMISTLSLLQYADIDSEYEMLGYGIVVIMLNVGMYFVAPTILLLKLNLKQKL